METSQREVSQGDLQKYAKTLDPCTICDHVCSHPGCWEASRKYVRQLLRLIQSGDYNPELIFEAQKLQQLEFEKKKHLKSAARSKQPLPTQKVCNLNENFSSQDGRLQRQNTVSSVTRISMELEPNLAEHHVQTSIVPSREQGRQVKETQSPRSSLQSRSSAQNEGTGAGIDEESEKLSSIFTPPDAATPKPDNDVLKDLANLPSLPPTPQVLPTNKIDPMSGFKAKKNPETVMIWVAPKKVSEPKYREQVFVMTQEGKAAVPNKNITNQMLPLGYEPENKFTLGGNFERDKTRCGGQTQRTKQNTTRIIPVQEEVINELLSLPKEILSQVLEQITAVDLLTPAKTTEVIDAIISQLRNARAIELSRVADDCVVSKPVPIYNSDAKKYHEQIQSFHTDPIVGLKLNPQNADPEISPKRNPSRVPDWIREQSMFRSYQFQNQSNHKLSKVSFNSLPPLKSETGGLFNRSKSIRKHYPNLESPVQRGLIPLASPIRSKPNSRQTSAQSKLSQISAALATLPSSPYSQYRTCLDRKQSALSTQSATGESQGVPKTPDTLFSYGSNWPGKDTGEYLSEFTASPRKETNALSTDATRPNKTLPPEAVARYPSVPPPSPDVNSAATATRRETSDPDYKIKEESVVASPRSASRGSTIKNAVEVSTKKSADEIDRASVEPTDTKTTNLEEETSATNALAVFPDKAGVTPIGVSLTTISEASINSVSDRSGHIKLRLTPDVNPEVKVKDEVNETTSFASNQGEDEVPGQLVTSQVMSETGSNASLIQKIDGFVSQDVESATFSQFSSLNRISLADIPNLEEELVPLTMEQSMRQGKVMSARKTVRFDEQNNENAEDKK